MSKRTPLLIFGPRTPLFPHDIDSFARFVPERSIERLLSITISHPQADLSSGAPFQNMKLGLIRSCAGNFGSYLLAIFRSYLQSLRAWSMTN